MLGYVVQRGMKFCNATLGMGEDRCRFVSVMRVGHRSEIQQSWIGKEKHQLLLGKLVVLQSTLWISPMISHDLLSMLRMRLEPSALKIRGVEVFVGQRPLVQT